ncbi:hypothetical protein FA95DRAFT_1607045 [Auriscalpium vulgare]|uniref:Uncharacterized protein n=1 Tax=Auriscalpium vulgare TaxID=40419 RepID=A0ACB8RQD7_9AGAM|nr:hypothetical protein FA95DRAFT_1607045 [Auriscalpium vulgare]
MPDAKFLSYVLYSQDSDLLKRQNELFDAQMRHLLATLSVCTSVLSVDPEPEAFSRISERFSVAQEELQRHHAVLQDRNRELEMLRHIEEDHRAADCEYESFLSSLVHHDAEGEGCSWMQEHEKLRERQQNLAMTKSKLQETQRAVLYMSLEAQCRVMDEFASAWAAASEAGRTELARMKEVEYRNMNRD